MLNSKPRAFVSGLPVFGVSTAFLLAALAGCASESSTASPSAMDTRSAADPHARSLTNEQLVAKYGAKISREANDPEFKPTTFGAEAAKAGLKKFAVIDSKPEPVPDVQMGDPTTVSKIVDEGLNRNHVMDQIRHLTQDIGPRLTGSANAEKANRWAQSQFQAWGLQNARIEEWGTIGVRFDRGPSTAKIVRSRERRGDDGKTTTEWETVREMEFSSLAWSPGTNGSVRGAVVRMPKTEDGFESVKDKLAGAWVVIPRREGANGRTGVRQAPGGMREYISTFADIRKKWAHPPEPMPHDGRSGSWKGKMTGGQIPGDGADVALSLRFAPDNTITGEVITGFGKGEIKNGKFDPATNQVTFNWERGSNVSNVALTLNDQTATGTSKSERGEVNLNVNREPPDETPKPPSIEERVLAAGPAGFLASSGDERVWTSAAEGWRQLTPEEVAKDVVINVRQSDYDYINSRLADSLDVYIEADMQHSFTPGPIPVYNTIAEIKGSEKPDEVVIISAHLDSWNGPGSQGCTDNGTGSSVTLEAARILSTVMKNGGKAPKRTIRFILWTGEEQGLLGSAGYVKKHEDELPKISAVFVDDGGTNYEGGLVCLPSMVPYLAAATAPVNSAFPEMTVNVHVAKNDKGEALTKLPGGGGSDHATFNSKHVPGFFWDEIGRANYGYGWHTQHDQIDLAIPEYLVQSSTCAAVTAYNLACAPDLLPRDIVDDSAAPADSRPAASSRPLGTTGTAPTRRQ